MSAGAYALGALAVIVVAAGFAIAAVSLRARLLPGWQGAPARLVEAIVAIGLAVTSAEALGLVGLLGDWSLIAVSLLLAGSAIVLFSRSPRGWAEGGTPPAPAVPPSWALVSVGVVFVVFAHWGIEAKPALDAGIGNFDSLWYHMPFAAEFAQSGSVTGLVHTETVFVNWSYPQNSELLHAIAILLSGRDALSLFLNFGWLAVALLAAWCAGRPYGRGPLTLTAAAIVLECHTLVVREPGAAKNDVAAAALVLAAVAILINLSEARRMDAGGAGGRRIVPGWGLGAAGLAAGLAAGTKVTVMAAVFGLTVAAIALAPAGRRRLAAAWWLIPAFAGAGFWYLRNLIVAANPIPQIRHLGPIQLPGPERLQQGRPDFNVLHYATDTAVWREYFRPELGQAFGRLWPIVLVAALGGALLALLRGPTRAIRWLGAVALLAMLAYLVTPLSAAGAEGAPVAFGINIRFLVPALLIGLVLLPVAAPVATASRRSQTALLVALVAVMVITNRSAAILRDPERLFGLGLALLVVLVPAGLIYLGARGTRRGPLAACAALLVLFVAAIGYPLQRDYSRDRFADFDTSMNLDTAYRWAGDTGDARIGLVGTTAGFLGYGFYGSDLSNRVRYLGQDGPHGAFNAIPTCRRFRAAVNRARLDFLVTAPFLNFIHPDEPLRSPEAWWLRDQSALRPVNRDGPVTVWKVFGRLDPAGCARIGGAPQRYVPEQPRS